MRIENKNGEKKLNIKAYDGKGIQTIYVYEENTEKKHWKKIYHDEIRYRKFF